MLTGSGLKTVRLLPELLIQKWIIKDNPELTEKLMEAGVRVFLHEMAGYKVTSEAIQTNQSMSMGEMVIAMGRYMVEQEKIQAEQQLLRQQLALEAQRTDELQAIVRQHEAELERIYKPDGDYYTIRGYANLKGFNVSVSEANSLGRKASSLSKSNGIPIEKMKDPRYGTVGCYAQRILKQVFG
jgi:hypothetical protein